ncbi:7626_t:CDS:1, partial [Paraglomus occultum]
IYSVARHAPTLVKKAENNKGMDARFLQGWDLPTSGANHLPPGNPKKTSQ